MPSAYLQWRFHSGERVVARGPLVFLYNLYIFVWIQHGCLANRVLVLDPSSSVIKRL